MLPRAAACHEPGMLVRGMIGNEIEQDLQSTGMGGCEQTIEILQRAELRIDAVIVRNIIAEVEHRRGKDRRDPDRIDAEFYQVRNSSDDARQIADTVAVRVLERAR